MAIQDITAKECNCESVQVGYYTPGSNNQDATPKTPIKRGVDTNTFGPPNNMWRNVGSLPETEGDYYVPGTNKK
jgi:hypothetical protein